MTTESTTRTVKSTVWRLKNDHQALRQIVVTDARHTDAEVGELVDCLLARPHGVTTVRLSRNQLTDASGAKLASYLAASTTIQSLSLSHNRLGDATYAALAAALHVNTSLRDLHLDSNQPADRQLIDGLFVDALRLNRRRPAGSTWWLFNFFTDDFQRLNNDALLFGHPTLQMLLFHQLTFAD